LIRTLASRQGISLPPPKPKTADELAHEKFSDWFSSKMTAMADEERISYKKFFAYQIILQFCFYYEMLRDERRRWKLREDGLQFVQWFVDRRRVWDTFWLNAGDNIGRSLLFNQWRRVTKKMEGL